MIGVAILILVATSSLVLGVSSCRRLDNLSPLKIFFLLSRNLKNQSVNLLNFDPKIISNDTYKLGSNVNRVDSVPDEFWPPSKELLESGTDQVWIELLGVLRSGEKTGKE